MLQTVRDQAILRYDFVETREWKKSVKMAIRRPEE